MTLKGSSAGKTGKIADNTATVLGTGAYAGLGTVTLSGMVTITGNTVAGEANNLWVNTVNSKLLAIGKSGLDETAPASNFTSDESKYEIVEEEIARLA